MWNCAAHETSRGMFPRNATFVGEMMKNLFTRFVSEEEGQDLIEYSLLAALIAVASIAAMNTLSTKINNIFAKIGSSLDAAPGGS
jgi:pilus assembly protein Flp/PilA